MELARLEQLIVRSLKQAADAISGEGVDLCTPFREQPEMQRVVVGALDVSLTPSTLPVKTRENFGVKFASWPGVGAVDVALIEKADVALIASGEIHAAFLELKWGNGTLYNCAWDLAKMATALYDDQTGARCGYLIAGAPATDWATADGAELFTSGTTRLIDLYEQYPSHWRGWCKAVKTHPHFLPQLVSRTLVASVPVAVRGEEWVMRCLRISAAAGSNAWWHVAPIEEQLGICGLCNAGEAQQLLDPPGSLAESPYPSDREVEVAEDHRLFDEGDVAALWRLVRNPPSWWKFIWFPGDVEFVGKSEAESWGDEPAQLLSLAGSIETKSDLERLHAAIEAFVVAHPGDATAISAGQSYVYAERMLAGH